MTVERSWKSFSAFQFKTPKNIYKSQNYLRIFYLKGFINLLGKQYYSFIIGYEILGEWISSIFNHLYWSIATCSGNGIELVERFTSVIHHVCNRHTFTGNKFYHKCSHDAYTHNEVKSRKWMKAGSSPHEALKKVVMEKQLTKDMEKINKNVYTTYLEVFHSLKIRYVPKSIFFEQEKMLAGAKLAALDHNANIKRERVKKYFAEYFLFL